MGPQGDENSTPRAVVLLCGGHGRRLGEMTAAIPKPLVPVAGLPILEHIIYLFYSQGFMQFHLAAGHRREALATWLSERAPAFSGLGVKFATSHAGDEAPTGDRLALAARELGQTPFLAAYGDCLADIDLHSLVAAHRAGGRLATMTCVRPASPFGVVTLDDSGRVATMVEKPPMSEWVNGGFFVLESGALDEHRPGEAFETGALPRLVAAGQVTAYPHASYWGCMDTPKDREGLERLCLSGHAPWPVPPGDPGRWPAPAVSPQP